MKKKSDFITELRARIYDIRQEKIDLQKINEELIRINDGQQARIHMLEEELRALKQKCQCPTK
jgi:hypothetical protein